MVPAARMVVMSNCLESYLESNSQGWVTSNTAYEFAAGIQFANYQPDYRTTTHAAKRNVSDMLKQILMKTSHCRID